MMWYALFFLMMQLIAYLLGELWVSFILFFLGMLCWTLA